MKKLKDQTNKLAHWLLKRLVFYLDRNDELIAYTFGRDDHTEYSVLSKRYYDDCYTVGTQTYQYKHTHRDMLRAMTDQDLAKWLYKIRVNWVCEPHRDPNSKCPGIHCADCWLEWLRREHK